MRRWILLAPLIVAACAWVQAADDEPPAGMTLPQYDDKGALLRPQGYEKWVFVGSSLGLSYDPNAKPGDAPGAMRNVYIQPEAYDEYARTGYFPDKTVLMMESYEPVENVTIARAGIAAGKFLGLEAAVKDYDRFELGWQYYNFMTPKGLAESARAFPKVFCWDCHAEHGADDNVFVQFYPVLKRALEQKK